MSASDLITLFDGFGGSEISMEKIFFEFEIMLIKMMKIQV